MSNKNGTKTTSVEDELQNYATTPTQQQTPAVTVASGAQPSTQPKSYATQFEQWYADQMGSDYAGGGVVRTEGMSDKDYYTGLALHNDYIAQGRANAQLQGQLARLDAQRSSAQQSAAIANEKLMKYLPQQLKAAGMGNLGVSQSAYIRQANNYATQRAAIDQSFNTAQVDLVRAHADAQAQRDIARNNDLMELERYYSDKEESDAKAADEQFLSLVQSDVWNSPEELRAAIDAYKGKVSEDALGLAEYIYTGYAGDHAERAEASKQADTEAQGKHLLEMIQSGYFDDPVALAEYIGRFQGKVSDDVLRDAWLIHGKIERDYERALDEKERAAADAKSAEARQNADAQIQDIFSFEDYEDYGGTPEQLRADLTPYLEVASDTVRQAAERRLAAFERWYEENADATVAAEAEIAQMEKDANVLEGRELLERRGQRWRITGEAIEPEEAYGKKFKQQLQAIGIGAPYDEEIENGTTINAGGKHYTYYKGDWYPSASAG